MVVGDFDLEFDGYAFVGSNGVSTLSLLFDDGMILATYTENGVTGYSKVDFKDFTQSTTEAEVLATIDCRDKNFHKYLLNIMASFSKPETHA